MISLIYTILLLFMLFMLYRAGEQIKKTNKVLSPMVISAVIVYTLNEGLRFGRGIDYNLYGMAYEKLERKGDSRWDVTFKFIADALIEFNIPWQGYVILMSFIFIVATIVLLKEYKDIIPFALPLFILFSNSSVENMVRWYLGCSFIMIGLAFLLGNGKKRKINFFLFSAFACTIHLALAPIPIIFYLVTLRKSPILKPLPILILYFAIAFSFRTDFMLSFVELANTLSMVSERFENYGNKAEYWLTGGFAGTEIHSALPSMQEVVFLCCIVVLGYKVIKKGEWKNVCAYNLFVIGLLANPIAKQIELVGRFDQPFFFFRAIVLACILEYAYRRKSVVIHKTVLLMSLLIFLNLGRRILTAPFKGNEEKYLYVWDSQGRTYQSMYDMWISDMYDAESKKKKN